MQLEKIHFQNKSDFAVLACAPHCHYRGEWMLNGSMTSFEMHDSTSTQTIKWFSFMTQHQLIGTRRTLGLTRSRRSYHHTGPFWTSLSRQSVVWRRPSKQIFRGLTYKWGWTTGKKQETVGLRWATSTHSSVHVYFCKRYSRAVSAVSPPRNALAGIDLRRLIYRAALMLKKLRAEKPQARNAKSLLFWK